jgi:hypothetical protein
VSYYFDKAEYAHKRNAGLLDFEPDDFVAGGVVCWDTQAQVSGLLYSTFSPVLTHSLTHSLYRCGPGWCTST